MNILARAFDDEEFDDEYIGDFEEEEYDGYNSRYEDSDNFLYDEDDYESSDKDYEGEDD